MINIYMSKRLVKRMPEKYNKVVSILSSRGEDVTDYLEYEDRRWLQQSEKQALNAVLLQENLKQFIKDKRKDHKLRDLMKRAKPVKLLRVITRADIYFVVKLSNGCELKCPGNLYWGSPIKETIKRLY